MKLGFTGTRKGMSKNQIDTLKSILNNIFIEEFHHGKCIGADTQAHEIAWDTIIRVKKIVIHPPLDKSLESKTIKQQPGETEELPPKNYLERNRDIVDSTDILIAAPNSIINNQNSGTWYTISYAYQNKKPVIIII